MASDYNKNMGFIDEADLSRAVCYLFIYGINLKSRKW
jgi:hypothetical protein